VNHIWKRLQACERLLMIYRRLVDDLERENRALRQTIRQLQGQV
jgi:archaellum component FlaD/FlaE